MIVGLFKYKFEDLPVFLLPGGGESAYISGEAEVEFNWLTRRWSIEAIFIRNEASLDGPLIQLVMDVIGHGVGTYQMAYCTIMQDRKENISCEVDRIIDTNNREGKAR
jgi:hypothetical protein